MGEAEFEARHLARAGLPRSWMTDLIRGEHAVAAGVEQERPPPLVFIGSTRRGQCGDGTAAARRLGEERSDSADEAEVLQEHHRREGEGVVEHQVVDVGGRHAGSAKACRPDSTLESRP